MTANSFGSRTALKVADEQYEIYRLDAVDGSDSLPFSLKVLLENLLRNEDGVNIAADHVTAVAQWDPSKEPDTEIQFTPARVILQDLTGVPAVVDLAAMREAMQALGGDPTKINPLIPAELVIDHSVVADVSAVRTRSGGTSRSSSSATMSATSSCAGASRRSASSRSCPRVPASCTR
jgi:aconitate hydratase